jgi:hypothetical protein
LSSDGAYAFLGSPYYGDVEVCSVAVDGTFSGCTSNGMSIQVFGLATNINGLYVSNFPNVQLCQPDGTGSVGSCQAVGTGFNGAIALAFGGQFAYVSNLFNNTISVCPVNSDGTWGTCTVATDASFNSVYGLTVN